MLLFHLTTSVTPDDADIALTSLDVFLFWLDKFIKTQVNDFKCGHTLSVEILTVWLNDQDFNRLRR